MTHTTTELSVMSTETERAPGAVGYEAVRFNAMKHGILSRYTVLSHENEADYESLVNSLMAEHLPAGATEQQLVEELASIIWRKRRVLQAEGATLNQGLKASSRNSATVVPAAVPFELGLSGEGTRIPDLIDLTPDEVMESQRESREDLDATLRAASILRKGGPKSYERALRALLPDSRDAWQDYLEDGDVSADADGLARFIRDHLLPICMRLEKEAPHHESIKNQALGEGVHAYKR